MQEALQLLLSGRNAGSLTSGITHRVAGKVKMKSTPAHQVAAKEEGMREGLRGKVAGGIGSAEQ